MFSRLYLFFVLLIVIEISGQQTKWIQEKYTHRMKNLQSDEFKDLALRETKESFEDLLDPLLIPRVSGTPNNAAVRKYIIENLQKLDWHIETDQFEAQTPHGKKPFENIIATLNPYTPRRLVLACHYDSKYTREYVFIGATDSAVPCAMLLHLAKSLQGPLRDHRDNSHNVTLQLIFFDGEEAFRAWSPTDSLYGSRHLAEKWEKTLYPPNNKEGTTELNRMDVMVLLDLLGVKGPKFYSFFQETSHLYSHFVGAEQDLRRSSYWTGSSFGNSIFKAQNSFSGVEDDHIPFLHRGVDIVHMIPVPFPKEWHTEADNKDALDFETIDNLNRILRVFTARYMHLSSDDLRPKAETYNYNNNNGINSASPLSILFNLFTLTALVSSTLNIPNKTFFKCDN